MSLRYIQITYKQRPAYIIGMNSVFPTFELFITKAPRTFFGNNQDIKAYKLFISKDQRIFFVII